MRIDQALKSKRFLGAKLGSMETRQTWLAVLKAAYAIPLSVKELALFHSVAGDRPPPTQRVRELWANAGRRSGKTELAAAIGVFHALIAPRKLSKGETGTVLIVAADRAQARVCKDYALAYIKENSELCNDIESETIDEIRLKNGVTISVQANSHKSVRGRAVLCAILDVLIDGAIDYSRPLELPPRPEHRYKCFVDPSGGRHDHYVICLVHKEGDRIVVDVVKGEQPPFDPHSVVQQFAALAREYGITEVTGDNYGANLVQAAWESCGIRYVRSPLNKSQLYIETLPSYTRGIVSIPKHKRLIRELRLLERKPHSGGRDSVDHPRGGTDDYGKL